MSETNDLPPLIDADTAAEPTEAVREALRRAVEIAKSQQKLVEGIGMSIERGHLSYWLKQGSVPEKHCAAIEQATGGKVTRRNLCPTWRRVWPELDDRREQALPEAAQG